MTAAMSNRVGDTAVALNSAGNPKGDRTRRLLRAVLDR
jgi:hypothetical protein